jgi:hypothetical protein
VLVNVRVNNEKTLTNKKNYIYRLSQEKSDLEKSIVQISQEKSDLETEVSLKDSSLDTMQVQLQQSNDELDSLRNLVHALNNPELKSKINYYTSSWESMCVFEKIVALLDYDSDWYTAIISGLELTEAAVVEVAEYNGWMDDGYYDIPNAGVACAGMFPDVYRLNEDWCVGLGESWGDFESSPFISITLISTKLQVEPIVLCVSKVSEIYISDDCDLIVSRQNVNPCWGMGLTYDLLYFENNMFKTLEVSFGGDEDGFDSPSIPFGAAPSEIELNKIEGVFSFTAFEMGDIERTGQSVDLFTFSNVSKKIISKLTF